MRVEVTRRNIDEGQPFDEHSCPIALALDRMDLNSVEVLGNAAYCWDSQRGVVMEAELPKEARDFIRDFDESDGEEARLLEPFSFDIEFKEMVND